jgi:flagellar FliL protein
MKKLLLLVMVVLLLGGGGAGAWLFLMQDNGAEAAEPPPPPDTPPVFVEFNPLRLPILGDDRVEQIVDIIVVLEVADQETADEVIAVAPRLTDAFMQDLYGELHVQEIAPNGTVDLRRIKRRLVDAANRTLGEGVVRDALVQMVNQRPAS